MVVFLRLLSFAIGDEDRSFGFFVTIFGGATACEGSCIQLRYILIHCAEQNASNGISQVENFTRKSCAVAEMVVHEAK